MFTPYFLVAILIHSTLATNLPSSGMFLVRILSEQHLRVQYCFTELPYPMKSLGKKCLLSGELKISNRKEVVLDLRLTNLTTEHVTVELEIVDGVGRSVRRLRNRITVDGALPAERISVPKGIIMEFVTVCDRPFYGVMCSRQCLEQDGANYVCDPRGEKVCLVGWTGKDCNIARPEISLEEPVQPSSSTPSPPSVSTGRFSTRKIETTTTSRLSTEGVVSTMPSATASAVSTGIPSTKNRVPTDSTPTSVTTATDAIVVPASEPTINTVYVVAPIDYVLMAFILAVLIGAAIYAIVKFVRTPVVQNWINRGRMKVFALDSIVLPLKKDILSIQKPTKNFPKAMEVEPKAICDQHSTVPRYSSPTRDNREKSPPGDISLITESSVYHEIDSFLVEPGTLV
ncbi:unnamed protein product [Haemonchus placei]|uniref:Delta-like protein n=1 Tax=Haemonchus placei TaxID=6290 RepID=A0A0N4WCX2_HAEPC|nr:unnamed protein product [Haemonchus placei]